MGGYGSGRSGGRPIAEHCLRIDLAWMLRNGYARDGEFRSGTLHWTCRGAPSGSISYSADFSQPGSERLKLCYTRGSGEDAEEVRQIVNLCHTVPHFGGKRWWMNCPLRGIRVGKLYNPPGGDRFASREAWRLGYQSQRDAPRDKAFERLFKLQEKLGCEQGWESYPLRPKGMWKRTYAKHMQRYREIYAECNIEMRAVLGRLERMETGGHERRL